MDEDTQGQLVTFETDRTFGQLPSNMSRQQKLLGWLVGHSRGFIADENQAGYVAFGFMLFIIAMTILFTILSLQRPTPSQSELERMQRPPISPANELLSQ